MLGCCCVPRKGSHSWMISGKGLSKEVCRKYSSKLGIQAWYCSNLFQRKGHHQIGQSLEKDLSEYGRRILGKGRTVVINGLRFMFTFTFGEFPKFFWGKNTGCSNRIIAHHSIVRVVGESWKITISTCKLEILWPKGLRMVICFEKRKLKKLNLQWL